MKTKFNFLLSVAWLFTLTMVNAQESATINGTPYLDEAYVQGVIFYGNKIHKAPIRYNAFQDLIEYQQNGQAIVLDPSATIKKVQLGTSMFVSLPYEINGKLKFGYFELLDSGKVTVFSRKKIGFQAARKGGALDGGDQPAQFKRSPDVFYYQIGNGTLQEIESIKSMIGSFPDKQEELTRFAKKEKISPKKEKEIIQFVQYYNSL